VPEGETGERLAGIPWLEPVFARHPAFEPSPEKFQVHSSGAQHTRYRLKPGVSIEQVRFDDILYADIALKSYQVFADAKRRGKVPAHCKFQVDLVPAHSIIWLYVVDQLQPVIDPLFNDAVLREIDRIVAGIPHRELAIQFDIASAVFARLERNQPSAYGQTKGEMQECFTAIVRRLADRRRSTVSLLLRRRRPQACGRSDRHGRHGRVRQSAAATDKAADPADPHAGPARALGRCVFRAARAAQSRAGHRTLPP